MAYLQLTDLRKSFGATVAVENFSLDVAAGEFVSFLGPSGCGKTTTMRMVAGFETPDAGRIRIDGEDITHTPANKRRVGMVFQSYALFPHLTVRDNVAFGLDLMRMSKPDIRTRVSDMLDLVQLAKMADRYPHQLSGGQQQRVALARALAIQPRVLLLDEPLSALDAKIRDELRNEIRRIQLELKITTIYVTHDQEEALALSDRMVVMNAGRIEQLGPPAEIYNRPHTAFVASFVGTQSTLTGALAPARDALLLPGGQSVRLAAPLGDRRPGESVTVHLRPEIIQLGEGTDGRNTFRGTVAQVMFLGSVVRLLVRAGEHTLSADILNNPALHVPQIGDAVAVHFAPEACQVL
jgi:putative spermidine/putrescine transport system ATP-binding protein